MTPAEALVHSFILDGLPEDIRVQHLIQMSKAAPQLNIQIGASQQHPSSNANPDGPSSSLPKTLQRRDTKVGYSYVIDEFRCEFEYLVYTFLGYVEYL